MANSKSRTIGHTRKVKKSKKIRVEYILASGEISYSLVWTPALNSIHLCFQASHLYLSDPELLSRNSTSTLRSAPPRPMDKVLFEIQLDRF
ncbi:hypothetical protein DPEC_G00210190 [Dallia pectoralis]|uniref:Uncharacterized protein n=1 Tax=Dallia pectoralis TaxID=75939 RepID=A0ACC2G5Q4_DALPE|nr:hypothetical protein DPEC_G00210190 [Dallia pectoralis]